MSSADRGSLVVGRVSGIRGNRGEVTVNVLSGDAARWTHLRRVEVGGGVREVEASRAYAGRLVLKLAGIDDAEGASQLRGADVGAAEADLPPLPEGVYWSSRLVGAIVTDATAGVIGRVEDLLETGGADVLVVRDDHGAETLIPLAREIVTAIDPAAGTIEVRLPDGLRDLS